MALTDLRGLATIITSSPSETFLIYPIPMPRLSRLGDGAPEESFPMILPSRSDTSLPGRGNGPFSRYFIPHQRSSLSSCEITLCLPVNSCPRSRPKGTFVSQESLDKNSVDSGRLGQQKSTPLRR